jgi:opine dehydrogenase
MSERALERFTLEPSETEEGDMNSLTILGGGNTAFACAAHFALRGREVTLCEIPDYGWTLTPIQDSRTIQLGGVAGQGAARLARVTADVAEALAANELALLIVPAYAHRPFAAACAPYLRRGQTVVLMPGTLGALEFARILEEAGRPVRDTGVTLAETDTAPFVCRKLSPDSAHIWGVVSGLGLGVFPAGETERVAALLAPLFTRDGKEGSPTAMRTYPNILACGLSAMNPVVHPAGVLMNAGRIEHARGEFYFYEEGVTPAVCEVIGAVDAERLALGKALGLELLPVAEAFHQAGFGPKGDLWAAINGSRMLTQLRAPGSVQTRWLTEDVPYGLATWARLGNQLGVETPVMDALVKLGFVVNGLDGDTTRRGLQELGLEGMSGTEMIEYVTSATGRATRNHRK